MCDKNQRRHSKIVSLKEGNRMFAKCAQVWANESALKQDIDDLIIS